MKAVYVAGPYTAATSIGRAWNVARANKAALALAEAGYLAIVPHQLGIGIDPDSSRLGEDYWYALTMRVMEGCDCVALIPGWEASRGANAERERAIELGMEVRELSEMVEVEW